MSRVALVTGASRGIGRAAALRLAEAGLDVAIASRTVRPGEGRDAYRDGTLFAGSLEETAAELEKLGGRVLTLPLDLADRSSVSSAVATVVSELGRIDVLVNNALFTNAPSSSLVLDLDADELLANLEANVVHPMILTREAVKAMRTQGDGGSVIQVASGVAYRDPPAPSGEGGWAYGYAANKAALARMAPILQVEHRDAGIRSFAIIPGGVATDAFKSAFDEETLQVILKTDGLGLVSIDVPAATIEFLANSPDAARHAGKVVDCETLCREHGLLTEEQIRG